MPARSPTATPPPSASTTAKKSTKKMGTRSVVGKAVPGDPGFSETAITLGKGQRQCLYRAEMTPRRLQPLSLIDFKPLYSGQNNTLVGDLFDARITERKADLESLSIIIEDLEINYPDQWRAAVNQYESALTATQADIALLKILILLREYSTHAPRFLDFVSQSRSAARKINIRITAYQFDSR